MAGMRKSLLLSIAALIVAHSNSYSQVLSGRVLAESGRTLAGVKVSFQNKANNITTRPDGSFKITATRLPDTLVFTAAGFEPYKVVITEKNIKDPDFEVVLLNTRKNMSEEVVISGEKRETKPMAYDDLLAKTSGMDVTEPRLMRVKTANTGIADNRFFFTDTNIAPREGVLAKSKILTAGEVNDFNKWKMWEDYTETEFRSYSNYWEIRTKGRFTLQLTDKKGNAVIHEAVYLISKETGDTVWKSFTDNTGKAELWSGFFSDQKQKDNFLITTSQGNTINDPSEFANGINFLQIDRACQVNDEVDIAFVVDATGSMGDEIEFLKLELEDVITSTMEKFGALRLRAGSVFYRDKGDEYLLRHTSFNEDLLKTLNFIKLQFSKGGGDYPEAVDDALARAIDSLHWNSHAGTKLLFLILDAPPHAEARERIQQLILQTASLGIRIIPVACSGTDKSTEFLLRSMALATNGTYTFLTNQSGIGLPHIEPTTDKYEIELLNSILKRIIAQFLYTKDCSKEVKEQEIKFPPNILSIKLYPNPTSGQFSIESNAALKELFITDFTGKILMRLPLSEKQRKWQVNISPYPAATYLIKYITPDNKWGAEKVVLMH
jgi:hypothetical protein